MGDLHPAVKTVIGSVSIVSIPIDTIKLLSIYLVDAPEWNRVYAILVLLLPVITFAWNHRRYTPVELNISKSIWKVVASSSS